MVRRSFRIGLRLGLLAGVIVALAKVVQSRRSGREESFPPPPEVTWPPLQGDPITVEPPAATTVTERIAPVRKAPVEPPPPPAPPAPAVAPPPQPAPADDFPPPPPPAPAPATPPAPAWAPAPDAAWAPAPASPPVGNQPPPVRFGTTTPSATGDVPPMAPASAEPHDPWTPPTVPPPEPEEVADEPQSAPAEASPAAPSTAARPAAKVAKVVKRAARQPVKKVAARKVAPNKGTPTPVRSRVRKARRQPWVEPFGTDTPTSHPVKAKLSSMLYHLPGMAFYNRTRPDRCYADAEAAEADGFIRAKR